jgi:predicted transcriptional regulator
MKKNIIYNVIKKSCSIYDALKIINNSEIKIVCLVNNQNQLLGIINDGDIRRSILKGNSLQLDIRKILNKKPICANYLDKKEFIYKKMLNNKINFIPLIKNRKLYDIISLDVDKENKKIDVFIMAGGLGKRLHPLTKKIPKALVKVTKNKTLIDFVIENLKRFSLTKINLVTFHKSNMIKNYINKKYKNDRIEILTENNKMGTAGGLSLLKKVKFLKILLL